MTLECPPVTFTGKKAVRGTGGFALVCCICSETMKTRYCYPCLSLQPHLVENEIFTSKGQRHFQYVCSTCGNRKQVRWGRAKTTEFVQKMVSDAKRDFEAVT